MTNIAGDSSDNAAIDKPEQEGEEDKVLDKGDAGAEDQGSEGEESKGDPAVGNNRPQDRVDPFEAENLAEVLHHPTIEVAVKRWAAILAG